MSSAIKARLDALAKATKRSKSSLAAEGITAFVELEVRQIGGIRQAMASLDRGKGVAHEEVMARTVTWDTHDV